MACIKKQAHHSVQRARCRPDGATQKEKLRRSKKRKTLPRGKAEKECAHEAGKLKGRQMKAKRSVHRMCIHHEHHATFFLLAHADCVPGPLAAIAAAAAAAAHPPLWLAGIVSRCPTAASKSKPTSAGTALPCRLSKTHRRSSAIPEERKSYFRFACAIVISNSKKQEAATKKRSRTGSRRVMHTTRMWLRKN